MKKWLRKLVRAFKSPDLRLNTHPNPPYPGERRTVYFVAPTLQSARLIRAYFLEEDLHYNERGLRLDTIADTQNFILPHLSKEDLCAHLMGKCCLFVIVDCECVLNQEALHREWSCLLQSLEPFTTLPQNRIRFIRLP